jgi:hypothetical protein
MTEHLSICLEPLQNDHDICCNDFEQVSRGLLPDTGSMYEGEGGNVNDALEFLLANFTEMNKLWVRMQHQGSDRDKYAHCNAGFARGTCFLIFVSCALGALPNSASGFQHGKVGLIKEYVA